MIKLFEDFKDIEAICEKYGIENYTINGDVVDVDGDVDLSHKFLTEFPLKFGVITGYFICIHNMLTTLEGAPISVGGNFNCRFNNLTSLKGCPESISGNFNCNDNNLTSLEGGPQSVDGNFNCSDNQLTSLEHCPRSVCKFFCSDNLLKTLEHSPINISGNFYCGRNKLTSLEGYPKVRGGDLYCSDNPVYVIYRLNPTNEFIELLNEYDVIRGNIIIKGRLEMALEDSFGDKLPNNITFKEYILK